MPLLSESESALREIDRLLAEGGIERKARSRRGSSSGPSPSAETGRERSGRAPELIRVPAWTADPSLSWLAHGFATRVGGLTRKYRPQANWGDLNLGFTAEDDPAIVVANRQLFLKAVRGNEAFSLAALQQIHSGLIHRIRGAQGSFVPATLKGDGLITSTPGILLAIQAADCIPVLLLDARRRAVAAFHAGWRGTLARIVENGVGRMRLEFGSRPQDMRAAIGPGIGQCCYSVGEDVRHEFESQFTYASELFREVSGSDPVREKYPLLFLTARAPGHSNLGPALHLDLAEANRRQLVTAGLSPAAIYLTGECTSCRPERFFSHRGEQGFTGRMMSVIGLHH